MEDDLTPDDFGEGEVWVPIFPLSVSYEIPSVREATTKSFGAPLIRT